ncbi:MAG: cupin domain-containing protein [Alphaproteobacteria bacterium]|nr:MAG: cupin domain-containing protein [Alphaproteobacteria bacterium]
MKAINLEEKSSKFSDHWSPKAVAMLNDYHVRLVKMQGSFVWHKHDDTDELFLVTKGQLTIEMRDEAVHLTEGCLFVVPKGVEHKPSASEECWALVIEPAETVNTGDAGGDMTIDEIEWV